MPEAQSPTPEARSYVDLQVNGYGGVDFNKDALTAEELHTACTRLAADDVAMCLVTIITDDIDRMCARLSTLARLRGADPLARRLVAGFHVEGPFINGTDGFRGAHPREAVRPADVGTMQRLLDAGAGLIRLVTLAPECDAGNRVTQRLAQSGVLVSAGHTDASLDQLRAAIDAGLSLFTHVGNACPMQLHRHDNIVQRALSLSGELWLCFIADGAHVPFPALGNYLKLAGFDRAIIVTDAIAPAGLGPGHYTLGHQDIVVGDDMVPRVLDRSHFVGSATTMGESAARLRRELRLTEAALRQLTSENARRVLGR